MSKSKDVALPKQVLNYLTEQNRPFNANDIFSNMKIDCGKTAMTRAIDLLVSEDKIKEKTYGKQKVYFVNQNNFADSKNVDVQSMDTQINELTNELNALQKEVKHFEDILKGLCENLTTEAAKSELTAIKSEISILKDKLNNLESKSGCVSPDEKKKIYENKERCMKEYTRRKRIATNIIDAILEGYPKSKKQLLEELGVEMDGDMKL